MQIPSAECPFLFLDCEAHSMSPCNVNIFLWLFSSLFDVLGKK